MEFVKIKGFEDCYEINKNGEIRNIKNGRMKKPHINNLGYYSVGLWKNGKQKTCLLHRLLAQTFINNPNNLPVVDHIDRNTKNNSLSNLRWASILDNNINSTLNGSIYKDNRYYKNKVYEFYRVRLGNRHIGYYKSLEEAEEARQKALIKHYEDLKKSIYSSLDDSGVQTT